jgi:hypothetical protein
MPEQTTIKPSVIETMLVNLVLTARANLPGKDGAEQENWVAERINSQIENYDSLIPGLAAYADLPYVDALQKQGVNYLVKFCIRKAYTWAVAHKALPEGTPETPAAKEATPEDKKVGEALGVPADAVLKPAEVPTVSGNTVAAQSQEATPDYEAILADEFPPSGGWYTFPPEKEGGEPHKEQGKEAALAYLKTRDDLVYEDEGGSDDATSQSN